MVKPEILISKSSIISRPSFPNSSLGMDEYYPTTNNITPSGLSISNYHCYKNVTPLGLIIFPHSQTPVWEWKLSMGCATAWLTIYGFRGRWATPIVSGYRPFRAVNSHSYSYCPFGVVKQPHQLTPACEWM